MTAFNAFADERIDRIEQAWNAGDQAATQQDFNLNAPREMAELASGVSGSIKITKAGRIDENVIAAKADINGVPTVMIFLECKDNSGQFCEYHHKANVATIGGAEYGQAADVATTLVGTSMGFAEANPMGLATIAYKAFWVGYSRSGHIGFGECVDLRTGLDIFGYGAAGANLATLAGAAFPASIGVMGVIALMRHETAATAAIYECAGFALENGVDPTLPV